MRVRVKFLISILNSGVWYKEVRVFGVFYRSRSRARCVFKIKVTFTLEVILSKDRGCFFKIRQLLISDSLLSGRFLMMALFQLFLIGHSFYKILYNPSLT